MPFVRFSRDKRGYEHIYLVHAPQGRGRSGPAKVLYWYRTPPGVRVGREPFDDTVRRALEAEYPNLQFDWKRIVNTPIPPPDAENWREKRRLMKEMREARAESEREARSSEEPDRPASLGAPDELAHASPDGLAEAARDENAPIAGNVAESSLAEPTPSRIAPAGEELRRRRGGRRRRRRRGQPSQQAVAPLESEGTSHPLSESASEPESPSESASEPESYSASSATNGSDSEANADTVSKAEPDLDSEPGDQK